MRNKLIFRVLHPHTFVKFHLKTLSKVFHNVKLFSVFPLSLLTPANIAKISRIPSLVLRLNYFYVRDRAGKTKLRQRLNVEVNIVPRCSTDERFNIKNLTDSKICRIFVM